MAARKKSLDPRFRVAPLGEVRAYTILEFELEKLEQGSPVSNLLTIGLCLLSAAVTLLTTLLSTVLPEKSFLLFFCAFLIFGSIGAICTFLGWRLRINTTELARQIRARMPDVPSLEQAPSPLFSPEQGEPHNP